MEPRGLRTHAVVTYLTPTEARMVEVARYLDGGSSPQPRSSWLLARAVAEPVKSPETLFGTELVYILGAWIMCSGIVGSVG